MSQKPSTFVPERQNDSRPTVFIIAHENLQLDFSPGLQISDLILDLSVSTILICNKNKELSLVHAAKVQLLMTA